jgi:hypothetical protein
VSSTILFFHEEGHVTGVTGVQEFRSCRMGEGHETGVQELQNGGWLFPPVTPELLQLLNFCY